MKICEYVPHGAVPDIRGFAPAIVAQNFAKFLKEDERYIISNLEEYKDARITICGFKNELNGIDELQKFYFSKSSSDKFLKLLKSSDLFVGVDAGPLHIANALGIKSIGIFGPTAPETIMDFDWDCVGLRDYKLNGVFCYVKDCKKAICMENAVCEFENIQTYMFYIREQRDSCPLQVSSHFS